MQREVRETREQNRPQNTQRCSLCATVNAADPRLSHAGCEMCEHSGVTPVLHCLYRSV